jgi:hypothetical protein
MQQLFACKQTLLSLSYDSKHTRNSKHMMCEERAPSTVCAVLQLFVSAYLASVVWFKIRFGRSVQMLHQACGVSRVPPLQQMSCNINM